METYNVNIEEIVKNVLNNLSQNGSNSNNMCTGSIPSEAKVAYLTAKEKIEVKTHKIPEINDDEILVKVEGCGVCGTDVHEYRNDPFGLIPVVLGHEGTGEIVKIGKNVKCDILGKPLNLGDKVVTCITITGDDEYTKIKPERMNLSDNTAIYGLLPDDEYIFNGWFGEYIILRKGSSIFNVSDLSLDQRMLVEPAAVTVHAVERAKSTGLLKFDSKVLVQGCGPIGMFIIAVLRTLGIENILAVDGNDKRLSLAKEFGVGHTFNFIDYSGAEAMKEDIINKTNGGVDFAFQCTGSPKGASDIYKFIRRGGGLCELGFFVDNGDATINPHFDLCNKEITLVGSWTYTFKDYVTTFDFLKRAEGIGLPMGKIITHRFGLDDLNKAIETNIKQEGLKVVYINEN